MKKIIFLALAAMPFFRVLSQTNADKEKAGELKKEAIRLMDNGDPDKAISLLDDAQKLDPKTYVYLYETGFALCIKKDYSKAIDVFRKTTKYPDANDQCYQMLGNAYDLNGDRHKAREAYAEGLKKFPSAGRLYMESGILDMAEKNYDQAAASWEKGIQVEPDYSSNYRRLAMLFAQTKNRIWAVFYGELFMNLERNTDRTAEMSQLLFNVYKMSISFPADSPNSVKLDIASDVINYDPKKGFKIPFHIAFPMEFLIGLALPVTGQKKEVTIDMLNRARVTFIDLWFTQRKENKEYPNVLLDYQRTLRDKGMLEAYNYWLLMKGDEEEFTKWRDTHRDQFEAFAAWFKDNPLKLDTTHLFLRTQYD